MEPIKPTAALKSKIRVQHEPADGGDAASGTISDLPLHILEKIFGYIVSPLESVRLAAVCKSWAAAVSEWLARPTPHLFALEVSNDDRHWYQFRPPSETEHHRWAIFSLPVEEEDWTSPVATARLPYVLCHPKGMKLSGALPCGRLSFASESRVVLVNPINTEEFKSIYLMAYTDGVFYALEFSGCTYTVDTRVPPPWRLTKLHVPSILEQYTPIRGVRRVGPVCRSGARTHIGGFEVFRLDVEGARWVKVERLAADRALFVSEQSSFAVRASEVPGCMSNCIYFVDEVDGRYYSCMRHLGRLLHEGAEGVVSAPRRWFSGKV